jgi:hypothetical protein
MRPRAADLRGLERTFHELVPSSRSEPQVADRVPRAGDHRRTARLKSLTLERVSPYSVNGESFRPHQSALWRAVTRARRRVAKRIGTNHRRTRKRLWITRSNPARMQPRNGRCASSSREFGRRLPTSPVPPGGREKEPLLQIATPPPAWAACLATFQRELTPQQFATWIRPLACAADADGSN